MTYLHFFFIILGVLCSEVKPARILGIYPFASLSHQVVFRTLTFELAKRGHELVVVTPDPILPKKRPPDNITEIDLSYTYKKIPEILKETKFHRGVVLPPEIMMTPYFYKWILYFGLEVFKNAEFKALLENKTQKFDLIISESAYMMPGILSKIYNAPSIWFSSSYGHTNIYDAFGAPARHPLLYPFFRRNQFYNLSVWEKIYQIYIELNFWYTLNVMEDYETEALKEIFGEDAPSTQELKNNIDLLFINTNPIFEGNRPVPPNIIHLGALHLQPVKALPDELKLYLDKSKRGVVYVSFGTNVRPSLMDHTLLEILLKAFEALPYDILWKFDGDNVPKIPKNVRVQKWYPQRDLLPHPNVKAFITQGGLQSTDEAIDSGVPLIGLPAMTDQWFNAEQYEKLGIGVKLDLLTLQVELLVNAVKTVITEKRYRENVIKLGDLMRDQPETPLERAVWWTEYVIRHKGAKHLRSSAAGISWSEYLMLDVVATLLLTFILLGTIIVIIVKIIVRCLGFKKKKVKKN